VVFCFQEAVRLEDRNVTSGYLVAQFFFFASIFMVCLCDAN